MKSCPACLSTYPSHIGFCPSDGNALVEFQQWTEGTVVRGKYRILSRVGQGGMGSVYKAVHLGFQELRALKVLNRELMSDPRFPRRFKQEAFTARKLVHPNVVRVEDIDESDDGHPFIAMEFVEGENLGHLIEKEGALPLPLACSIVKQIADALDFAHQMGVIHRDIKPHNVALVVKGMQSRNGSPVRSSQGHTNEVEVKVLDFGIAKLREACAEGKSGTLTQTGLIVGTPQYMSPEQAKGKRGDDLDGRSDIYSLGVVMYQMLTGVLPFTASTTVEMLVAHLQEVPRPLQAIRPDLQIPDPIAEIVMKCLEKNRELRPSTGRALIQAIENAEEAVAAGGATNSRVSQLPPMPVMAIPPVMATPEAAVASQLVAPFTDSRQIAAVPLQPRPVMASPDANGSGQAVAHVTDSHQIALVTPPSTPVPVMAAFEENSAIHPITSATDVQQSVPPPVPAATNPLILRGTVKPAKPFLHLLPFLSLGWVRWATSFVSVALAVIVCLVLVRHRIGAQPQRKQIAVQPQQAPANAAGASASGPVLTPLVQSNVQAVAEPTPAPVPEADRLTNEDPSDVQSSSDSQSGEAPVSSSRPSLARTRASNRSISRADQRAALEKQIYAAVAEGDAAYENGEYDGAISAYREGLKLDSKNKVLIHRIEKAQRAKTAEEGANQ